MYDTADSHPRSIINSIGMKLNLVPSGRFLMGSPTTEEGRAPCETQHEVEITKPFYMGVYEVTQHQYETVIGNNPSAFSPDRFGGSLQDTDPRRLPVERVSWDDAVDFCNQLSSWPEEKLARRHYRLPTEAEWEYASRGGAVVPAPFSIAGNPSFELSSALANFAGNAPYGRTSEGPALSGPAMVGSYHPNGFGLYDMHGNVSEWCSDWYGQSYYCNHLMTDPRGPREGLLRVIRGGAFTDHGVQCRCASRLNEHPDRRSFDIGFRVVCVFDCCSRMEGKQSRATLPSGLPPDCDRTRQSSR
jgi:formylglycine-generating enzyme required for sulfatase activity